MTAGLAAVLYEIGKPLMVESLTVPDLARGQVLVRVVASGFCHKQLEEMSGKRGKDPYLPHMLGHEGSGIVEEIGPEVSRVSIGDHVVLSWIKGSGIESETPTFHKEGRGPVNAGWVTTFNEYCVASENRVTPIRKDMPLDRAALLGCAVPTGAGAIMNQASIGPRSSVAIFGVGGIGLCAVQAAAYMGARMIIAVDVLDRKLVMSKKFGATHTVNASNVDVLSIINDLTGGIGVDVTFESTGRIEAMNTAYAAASKFHGLTIIAGVNPVGTTMTVDPNRLHFGLKLIGTSGGSSDPDVDIPTWADLYMNGDWKLDELITHRFTLREINEAASTVQRGEVGRAVIEL